MFTPFQAILGHLHVDILNPTNLSNIISSVFVLVYLHAYFFFLIIPFVPQTLLLSVTFILSENVFILLVFLKIIYVSV